MEKSVVTIEKGKRLKWDQETNDKAFYPTLKYEKRFVIFFQRPL
jgi:hypothetical protein